MASNNCKSGSNNFVDGRRESHMNVCGGLKIGGKLLASPTDAKHNLNLRSHHSSRITQNACGISLISLIITIIVIIILAAIVIFTRT